MVQCSAEGGKGREDVSERAEPGGKRERVASSILLYVRCPCCSRR
jgi:hypothetical protein